MTDWLKNPASLFDVRGKVAVVTGASGAFGALAAKVLAGAGTKLFISTGNAKELEKLAGECKALGADVETLAIRTTNEANCGKIIDAAVEAFRSRRHPRRGVGQERRRQDQRHDARALPRRDGRQRHAVLADGASGRKADAGARCRTANGNAGKIVLMSSARGLLGHPAGYTAYCSSKSAIDGMTKALGCELGPTGITVNAIAPTVFRSPLTAWMYEDNENATNVRKGFLARVPKGRLGEPSDLAGPLLFLASDASAFYTGHILYADGGYTAG